MSSELKDSEKTGEKATVSELRASDDLDVSTYDDLYGADSIDPVYRAKAHLLNEAVREIGMGRYQVRS